MVNGAYIHCDAKTLRGGGQVTRKLDNCQGVLQEEELRKLVDSNEMISGFHSQETMRETTKKSKGVPASMKLKSTAILRVEYHS